MFSFSLNEKDYLDINIHISNQKFDKFNTIVMCVATEKVTQLY